MRLTYTFGEFWGCFWRCADLSFYLICFQGFAKGRVRKASPIGRGLRLDGARKSKLLTIPSGRVPRLRWLPESDVVRLSGYVAGARMNGVAARCWLRGA